MKYLIIGLGNPGTEYENTRHNLGYRIIDEVVDKIDSKTKFVQNKKLLSEVTIIMQSEITLIFAKPLTYMNLSGEAVSKLANYYEIDPEQIIVCSDDINLDVGVARIRFGGESGGHNGLKSIISKIGESFWRVRLGIGKDENIPQERYVLGKVTEEGRKTIDQTIDKLTENLVELITRGELKNITIN